MDLLTRGLDTGWEGTNMCSESRHCSESRGGQGSKEELVLGSHSGQCKPSVPGHTGSQSTHLEEEEGLGWVRSLA